jgi:hypothetical protein
VKAIAFWVRKRRREGAEIALEGLNEEVVCTLIREMTLASKEEKRDDKLFYPNKFNPKKYISWAQSFENYLDSLKGKSKVPLTYIIRPDDADPEDAETEYQRMIWAAPHEGYAYDEDNREVYRIYKDVMIDTDGWTWFSRADEGDGRGAHEIISLHYRGDAETARRAAEAEALLERLHYKNEASFSFERYITRLNECFELMDDNDQGLSEAQKVKKLLKGVTSTNPEVIAIKAVVRSTHPTDFNRASTLIAGQIAVLFPAVNTDMRPKRKISALEGNQNGRGRGGRARYTGARNGIRGNPTMFHGVDVSDPTRNFTTEEWTKLREAGFIPWLLDRRAALRRGGRGRGGGRTQFQRGSGRGGRGGNHREGETGRQARRVAFLETIPEEQDNQVTQQETEVQPNNNRGGQAGNAFGGRRYQRGGGRD